MNWSAVAVSAILAVVFSAAYYIAWRRRAALLGAPWAQRARPPGWQLPLELVRALVVASVVGGVVSATGVARPADAVVLAVSLWVAFPVVLLIGSVTQEKTPPRLAAIHAGDWLAKLLIVALITSSWR